MNKKSCYSPELMLSAGGPGADMNLASVREWLAGTRQLKLRQAAPAFILQLDRMSKTAMSAEDRLDALREFKRPLLKLVAALPKPLPRQEDAKAAAPLLEQRLYCLMFKNLRQGLEDMDQSPQAFSAEVAKRRRWTVRNLFRFLARQIELSSTWLRPVPPNTWQSLYDLDAYLTARSQVRPGGQGRRNRRLDDLDPELEYRRLLLLGALTRLFEGRQVPRGLIDRVVGWARETRLAEPGGHLGELGAFVVEVSKDAPPRRIPGALNDAFRGWVLIPPPELLDAIAAPEQSAPAFDPSAAIRAGFRAV